MPNRFPFNTPEHPEDNRSINKAFDRNYGNRLKSGDTTPLKYTIKDGDGEPLDKDRLMGMETTVKMKHEGVTAYEAEFEATLEEVSEGYEGDLVARYKIMEALPPSDTPYIVEFHFEEADDRFIFPSGNNLPLYITPSSLNSDGEAIKNASEQRLNEIVERKLEENPVLSEAEAKELARQENYQELLDTGVMQTKINERLEDLEEEYAPKLTEVTAQLAQKANYSYVDNKVRQVAGGAPKGTYPTLTELQNALPNGDEGNYVVAENGHIFNWDGDSWVDTDIIYQAVGIAEGSVTPKETTFAKKGKNLFDGNFINGLILAGPIVTTDLVRVAESETGYSAIVKVEPNTDYFVSKKQGTSDRMMVGFSETYPQIGDELEYFGHQTLWRIHVRTGNNDRYLIVYLSSEDENKIPEEFQVELGDTQTIYEDPQSVSINFAPKSIPLESIDFYIPEGSVTPKETTFAKKGKNLFDGNFINGVILAGPIGTTGILKVEEREAGYSAIVKVEPNTDYFVSKKEGTSNMLLVGLSETYPQIGGDSDYVGNFQRGTHVQTGNNHHYLMVFLSSVDENKTPEEFQVELGVTQTTYEDPQAVSINFAPESIPLEAIKESKFYIDDVLHGTYVPSEPSLLPYTNPWTADLETVYSIYDTLVANYPNYVTRTLLGEDSSGLPIYRYDFKPGNVKYSGNSLELPKIVVSNTHSFERQALLGGTKFWVDLCDNWKTNELLRTMRWNVHFVVLPVPNPYGLEHVQRPNANGVDLNRNFTAGWNKVGEPGGNPADVTYAGEAPLSEVETQLFNQFMEENKDALFAIDMHNYNTLQTDHSVLYLASSVPETQKIIAGPVQKMSSYAQEKYIDGIIEGYENESLGFINKHIIGGSTVRQWESKGVRSVLLELVADFGTTHEDVQYFSTATLGNLILTVLRKLI